MKESDSAETAPPEHNLRLGEIGLNHFAPYLMNRIMGRYNASLRDEMMALGLTTVKMRTLAVLSIIDGILIRELAVYAVVEQSTLSRALDAMLKEDLIERKADAEDSRAIRIFITAKGRQTFETLWPHILDSYQQMFVGISEEEHRAFVGTLHKILGNIRKHQF